MSSIAVVGAGVIGISSAYSLKLANYDVTIIAENFSPQTTSDGAAGVLKFGQGNNGMQQTPSHLLAKWFAETYNWCNEILKQQYSSEIGISRVSGYVLYDHKIEGLSLWGKLIPDGRLLNEEELKRFDADIKSGIFGTTMMCEGKRYLPWLMKRFMEKGGKVVKRKVMSFKELSSYDVIVNCSGLGSHDLCNDKEIVPWRGQVMRMEAPWIRHFYHVERSNSPPVYIYPNINNVVVGGTYQQSGLTEISENDKQVILENALKFEPSLKNAKITEDWVGFRPARSSVRVEKEDICYDAKSGKNPVKIKVVHNYGHGPSGITFHWGCAQNVVKLVEETLQELQEKNEVKAKL